MNTESSNLKKVAYTKPAILDLSAIPYLQGGGVLCTGPGLDAGCNPGSGASTEDCMSGHDVKIGD